MSTKTHLDVSLHKKMSSFRVKVLPMACELLVGLLHRTALSLAGQGRTGCTSADEKQSCVAKKQSCEKQWPKWSANTRQQ